MGRSPLLPALWEQVGGGPVRSCPQCQGPLTPICVEDADGTAELMDEICETAGCDWEVIDPDLGDAVIEP